MTVGANVKGCYYSLKSATATCEQLALKTMNKDAQRAFTHAQQLLEEVKNDLEKQITFLAKEERQYE